MASSSGTHGVNRSPWNSKTAALADARIRSASTSSAPIRLSSSSANLGVSGSERSISTSASNTAAPLSPVSLASSASVPELDENIPENVPRKSFSSLATSSSSSGQEGNVPVQTYAIKMLMENNHAGSIIGKRGSTINQLQEFTGARIKISQSHDHFPGTRDRVSLVEGPKPCVVSALSAMLAKCYSEPPQRGGTAVGAHSEQAMRFLVPVKAIQVVESASPRIQKETSCKLTLERASMSDSHDEIAVAVHGNLAQVHAAAKMLLDAIHASPGTYVYANKSTHYNVGALPMFQVPRPGAGASELRAGYCYQPAFVGPISSVQIYLHDSQIGSVVGRGGCHINEIQRTTSTRIKVSQRNVFLPGTQNRILTITGPTQGIQAAQVLIMERASPIVDARGSRGASPPRPPSPYTAMGLYHPHPPPPMPPHRVRPFSPPTHGGAYGAHAYQSGYHSSHPESQHNPGATSLQNHQHLLHRSNSPHQQQTAPAHIHSSIGTPGANASTSRNSHPPYHMPHHDPAQHQHQQHIYGYDYFHPQAAQTHSLPRSGAPMVTADSAAAPTTTPGTTTSLQEGAGAAQDHQNEGTTR